jgi:hypothetical protein
MAKNHTGDHVDIDPFIPTGICALCTNEEQDLTPPEFREGASSE